VLADSDPIPGPPACSAAVAIGVDAHIVVCGQPNYYEFASYDGTVHQVLGSADPSATMIQKYEHYNAYLGRRIVAQDVDHNIGYHLVVAVAIDLQDSATDIEFAAVED
jgi:hypothetical protein